jgi:3D (Asp-Asp-Asp) domain-containing protein
MDKRRNIISPAILVCFILLVLFSLQSNSPSKDTTTVKTTKKSKVVGVSSHKPALPVTLVTNHQASYTQPDLEPESANQPSPQVKPEPRQVAQAIPPATRTDNTVSRGGNRTLMMVATGYTSAPEENYPYTGQLTYTGIPPARGIVAVDPNVISMGTRLYVEGYGEAVAADQGGAIKGNRIDLFFDNKSEAYNWGIRTVEVTIYS